MKIPKALFIHAPFPFVIPVSIFLDTVYIGVYMNLFIVESPGKVKKIQGFLGNDWLVMATYGHVRDLPENEIGVAAPDFKPHYVPTGRGKDVLAKLAEAAKNAEAVYLATDPDRESLRLNHEWIHHVCVVIFLPINRQL